MCEVTTAYKNYMMENKTPNFGVIVSRLKIAIMIKKIFIFPWYFISPPLQSTYYYHTQQCFFPYLSPIHKKKKSFPKDIISSLTKSQFSLIFFLILFMQWNDSMAPDNLGSKAALSLSLHMEWKEQKKKKKKTLPSTLKNHDIPQKIQKDCARKNIHSQVKQSSTIKMNYRKFWHSHSSGRPYIRVILISIYIYVIKPLKELSRNLTGWNLQRSLNICFFPPKGALHLRRAQLNRP